MISSQMSQLWPHRVTEGLFSRDTTEVENINNIGAPFSRKSQEIDVGDNQQGLFAKRAFWFCFVCFNLFVYIIKSEAPINF